jgi:hypothetical protein
MTKPGGPWPDAVFFASEPGEHEISCPVRTSATVNLPRVVAVVDARHTQRHEVLVLTRENDAGGIESPPPKKTKPNQTKRIMLAGSADRSLQPLWNP